jgi:hypothetical protein
MRLKQRQLFAIVVVFVKRLSMLTGVKSELSSLRSSAAAELMISGYFIEIPKRLGGRNGRNF